MYGWRARIGLLAVASDVTCEMELHSIAPEGVSINASRMAFPGAVTAETVGKLADEAEKAAELLIPTGVNVIAFCCTSGSFIKGAGWDRQIIEKIEKRFPGVTVTTTSTAVLEAFRTLEIKKVAIATPYIDEINVALKKFLEMENFPTVSIEGLGIKEDQETNNQPPEVAYNLARKVDVPEADGIFISCTSFRTFGIIETLERDLRKPVVTSNQATMWDVLKKADVHGPIKGYGKLLTLL